MKRVLDSTFTSSMLEARLPNVPKRIVITLPTSRLALLSDPPNNDLVKMTLYYRRVFK